MRVNLHGGGADFYVRLAGRLSSLQKYGSSLQKVKSRSMRRVSYASALVGYQ